MAEEEETTTSEEETGSTNKPITSDEELKKVVGDIAAGIGTNIPKVDAVQMGETTPKTVASNELMDKDQVGIKVGDVSETDKATTEDAAGKSVTLKKIQKAPFPGTLLDAKAISEILAKTKKLKEETKLNSELDKIQEHSTKK